MKFGKKPPKKPENENEDENGNTLIELDPDDIFSEHYNVYIGAERFSSVVFVVAASLFYYCLREPDQKKNIASVVMYPQLFATFYIFARGVQSSIRKYIVLILIGILMQVQIMCLMSEYVIAFQKDQRIFDVISRIFSQIPIDSIFLVIGFTFILQLSNLLVYYVHQKKVGSYEEKINNIDKLENHFKIIFLLLLFSFVMSLFTPEYRFASVLIYPQLFTQFYLVKSRFQTERIELLKYFGYGVAMQVHTLLLMFVYSSTWDLEPFNKSFFSTPFLFHTDFFYLALVHAAFYQFFIISPFYSGIEQESDVQKSYVNNKHRRTMVARGFILSLIMFCSFLLLINPSYCFGVLFFVPQFLVQLQLVFTRCVMSYKHFMGILGIYIFLQFQAWLLIDPLIIFLKRVFNDGISTIFDDLTGSFVFVVIAFTFMFQLANVIIYFECIKSKNSQIELKKNGTIKALYKSIHIKIIFSLIWSLVFTQYRFASMILVPQLFTQFYLLKKGYDAEFSQFKEALKYGFASQLTMLFIIHFDSAAANDATGKPFKTLFETYPDFSQHGFLIIIGMTMFVQISNAIVFFIQNRRNKKSKLKKFQFFL